MLSSLYYVANWHFSTKPLFLLVSLRLCITQSYLTQSSPTSSFSIFGWLLFGCVFVYEVYCGDDNKNCAYFFSFFVVFIYFVCLPYSQNCQALVHSFTLIAAHLLPLFCFFICLDIFHSKVFFFFEKLTQNKKDNSDKQRSFLLFCAVMMWVAINMEKWIHYYQRIDE